MTSILASKTNKRSVKQIEPATGKCIKIWTSMSKFLRDNNHNNNNGNITISCQNWENTQKRSCCHKYWWEYVYYDLSLQEGEDQITLKIINKTDIVINNENIKLINNKTHKIPSNICIITSFGRYFNSKQQRFIKGYLHNSGYYKCHKKNKFFGVHRLVAFAFKAKGYPEGYTYKQLCDENWEVDHIYQTKEDNNINHLEWMTRSTHRRKSLKDKGRKPRMAEGLRVEQIDKITGQVIKIWDSWRDIIKYYENELKQPPPAHPSALYPVIDSRGYKWKFIEDELLEGEIFKKIKLICPGPGPRERIIQVSNMGRVINKRRQKWRGTQRVDGYYQVKYSGKIFKVHRLVAEAFHPEALKEKIKNSGLSKDGLEVDHIDGINTNNNADNLIWLTRKEHMKKEGKVRRNNLEKISSNIKNHN